MEPQSIGVYIWVLYFPLGRFLCTCIHNKQGSATSREGACVPPSPAVSTDLYLSGSFNPGRHLIQSKAPFIYASGSATVMCYYIFNLI